MLQEHDAVLDDLHLNLLKAQQRMKLNADKNRCDDQFEVVHNVYVKIQPYRERSLSKRPYEKLAAKFMALQRVGQVAYRLQLPDTSKIHPEFHIFQLK